MDETRALPDAERRLDGAACGLLLTESSGLIRKANATFCSWIGLAPAMLEGKRRFQDLFTVGGRVFHQTHLAPLLQMQGSVAEVTLDMRHAEGHVLPVLFNIFRHAHAGGTFDEIAVFVATDRRKYEHELLLARKKAEASLQALAEAQQALNDALAERQRDAARLHDLNAQLALADRKKDEFLATLAHELRNPLAPLRNVLEIFRMKSPADPQLTWAQEVFERQMSQISHLVDDLLEISRITQGRVALRKQQLDLADVMRAAVEATATLVNNGAHKLATTLPADTLLLDADATRLTQILTNLLNNAAKYTPDGGHIWFDAWAEGGEAVISVRDSGIGIAPDNLANVFTMFAQLEPALKRAQGGLGIGLALVKGLVELHGGAISAHSAGAGQGSQFIVRLPLLAQIPADASAPAPASGSQAPPPLLARRNVLVVDDNRDAADMLRMALDMLGYTARCAYDGPEALGMATAEVPDVIVLDIGLPGMDGYAVARAIRTQAWGRDVMLVAATGWGQQRDKEEAVAAGFDHHLVKPVDFTQLDALLRG